jgi:hypothetical protein
MFAVAMGSDNALARSGNNDDFGLTDPVHEMIETKLDQMKIGLPNRFDEVQDQLNAQDDDVYAIEVKIDQMKNGLPLRFDDVQGQLDAQDVDVAALEVKLDRIDGKLGANLGPGTTIETGLISHNFEVRRDLADIEAKLDNVFHPTQQQFAGHHNSLSDDLADIEAKLDKGNTFVPGRFNDLEQDLVDIEAKLDQAKNFVPRRFNELEAGIAMLEYKLDPHVNNDDHKTSVWVICDLYYKTMAYYPEKGCENEHDVTLPPR